MSYLSELQTQAGELSQCLRHVGLLLLNCDSSGKLVPSAQGNTDWLEGLFCNSPLFQKALHDAARMWEKSDNPQAVKILPGVWIDPIPVFHRRQHMGYSLTLIPTQAFLQSEQLAAVCQSAQQDFQVIKNLLSDLELTTEVEVSRLGAIVRFAHKDQRQLLNSHQSLESIGQQLGESYEEINLLYTIIQSMKEVQNPSRFISMTCDELLATLPYAWVCAQMSDDKNRLKQLSGMSHFSGQTGSSPADIHPLCREIMVQAEVDTPMVLEPAYNPDHERYAKFGRTALVHPISSDGQVIGILVVGDKQGEDPAASSVDMKLLGATASHMAIFLENAALYEDLNRMFMGTLEALTASIDAKDRYTCGHSERVAKLTQQLATAVGLDERTVQRMHIAGLVHDVGKIGVPEAVLTKPGRLTPAEFDEIKKHPEIGYRILKDIPQLQDILPGVLYHHERWDGCGYPHGLHTDKIPVIARLIALADSFDAMSSNRTYRSRLSRTEVLSEIKRCAGTQFDPELAPIFIELDFSEFDRMVQEHQEADMNYPTYRQEDVA